MKVKGRERLCHIWMIVMDPDILGSKFIPKGLVLAKFLGLPLRALHVGNDMKTGFAYL